MKKITKEAFTLIEVLIATSILTIAVFWVYKLIWENTKIINNSDNYLQANTLFPSITECIENIWFENFKWMTQNIYEFHFWPSNTWCFTGSSITTLDNIDYQLWWNITSSWAEYIEWNITVESDEIGTLTETYKQIKK
jgi:prepilin-type N-terminal cleavage/methylation domain-containing protein